MKRNLRATRVWQSIFRSGEPGTKLHNALAIQQNFFLHMAAAKIRRRALAFRATWYLGILSLGSFAILAATGIALMLYYHPSVTQAYADMKDLQFVVSAGVFLRNLHRWGAHAMVVLVFAHMCKVFYRGAYRPPREFNWVVGVMLLLLTLLLSYTGYLLPWDQLAFWAITVGSNLLSAVPWAGPKIRFLLLGGNGVNGNALLRFYVLHCVILPLIAAMFLGVHFWRIRKDKGLYIPPTAGSDDNDFVMAWPEAAQRVVIAIEVLTGTLVAVSLVWNAPLESLADPLQTPNPAKAPWYFLGLQELLHYFPPIVAGVLIPAMVVMALVVIPYFRVNVDGESLWARNGARRLRAILTIVAAFSILMIAFRVWVVLAPTLAAVALMTYSARGRANSWLHAKPLSFWIMSWFLAQAIVLTIVGTFFRGPGWSLVSPI